MRPRLGLAALAIVLAVASARTAAADPVEGGRREAMLDIMVGSSANVSRTKVYGDAFLFEGGERKGNRVIKDRAEKNFVEAVEFVLDNADDLPINLDTARAINMRLTKGLVPEGDRGNPNYHKSSRPFYKWLNSQAARQLAVTDPVGLAQKIHRQISLYDAFPDGNGRTARMMADLVLIKSGRAPARYTQIGDYFERGVAIGWKDKTFERPAPTLETQEAYYREVAAAGERELARRGFASTRPGVKAPDQYAHWNLKWDPERSWKSRIKRALLSPLRKLRSIRLARPARAHR